MATALAVRPAAPLYRRPQETRIVYRTPPAAKERESALRGQLGRVRAAAAAKADPLELLLAVAVGTGIAGIMDSFEMDTIAGFDARLAVGGAAIAVALVALKGRPSRLLLGLGVGIIAPALNDLVDDLFTEFRNS